MTKQELAKQVKGHRDQIQYRSCFDQKDFHLLTVKIKNVILELETALLTNSHEYSNLESHIDKLKTIVSQHSKGNQPKYLCRELRRDVLVALKDLISDNSNKSEATS